MGLTRGGGRGRPGPGTTDLKLRLLLLRVQCPLPWYLREIYTRVLLGGRGLAGGAAQSTIKSERLEGGWILYSRIDFLELSHIFPDVITPHHIRWRWIFTSLLPGRCCMINKVTIVFLWRRRTSRQLAASFVLSRYDLLRWKQATLRAANISRCKVTV